MWQAYFFKFFIKSHKLVKSYLLQEFLKNMTTVQILFSGTPLSGHPQFSEHVFAPLKNQLNWESRDFGKKSEKIFLTSK